MKNNLKGYLLLFIAILAAVAGIVLLLVSYKEYAIICFIISIVLLIISIVSLLITTKPLDRYEKEINDIIKTYDSVLAKTNNIPDLYEKNIILIDSIEDLVDIELEVRKPIVYFKQIESCSFILIDNDIAYIYIKKTSDDVESPVEHELKEVSLKKKNLNGIDSDILNSLEKTEIIKLPNRKSYKVSPVRKKQQEELERFEEEIHQADNKIVEKSEENNVEVPEETQSKKRIKEIFTEDIVEDVLDEETVEKKSDDDLELI